MSACMTMHNRITEDEVETYTYESSVDFNVISISDVDMILNKT